MHKPTWMWLFFIAIVLFLLVLDLGVLHKNSKEIGMAESFAFSAFYITLGVLFGGVDYSASLGADLSDWDAMLTARGTIAAACGAAGVPAYDVPYLDTSDTDGLAASTRKAKAFGFSGRACIHPDQVATTLQQALAHLGITVTPDRPEQMLATALQQSPAARL